MQQRVASIDLLPAELLEQVMSMFKIRPRILVLALVCRRWNSAALRSVRHLNARNLLKILTTSRGLLSKFPNVTTLTLPQIDYLSVEIAVDLATRARLLKRSNILYLSEEAVAAFIRHCTRLTSLESTWDPPHRSKLLEANAETLEHLSVEVLDHFREPCEFFLPYMPRLRSLSLRNRVDNNSPFFYHQLSTLTRLTLEGVVTNWAMVSFAPSLRKLKLLSRDTHTETNLLYWLSAQTSITSLSLVISNDIDIPLIAKTAPILTSVSYYGHRSEKSTALLISALLLCQRLRRVELADHSGAHAVHIQTQLASRLHCLSLNSPLEPLGHLLQMRKLNVIDQQNWDYFCTVAMPHLDLLRLPEMSIDTLAQILFQFISLRRVLVRLNPKARAGTVNLASDANGKPCWPYLEQVLLKAEQNGLNHLWLGGVTSVYRPAVIAAAHKCKWLSVRLIPGSVDLYS